MFCKIFEIGEDKNQLLLKKSFGNQRLHTGEPCAAVELWTEIDGLPIMNLSEFMVDDMVDPYKKSWSMADHFFDNVDMAVAANLFMGLVKEATLMLQKEADSMEESDSKLRRVK